MAGRAIDLSIDAREFHNVLKAARYVDAKISTGLRRNLKRVADEAVADVKRTVGRPPMHVGAHSYSRGLRADLAQSTKVTIAASEGGRRVGVFIRTNPSTPRGKALVGAYDKPGGWRHPVFGSRKTWTTQTGRPYFGSVINLHATAMDAGVRAALQEAVDAINSHY